MTKTAMRLAVVVIVSSLPACGGSQKPDDKTKSQELTDQPPVTYETPPGEAKPVEAPPGEAHVELAEITVFDGTTEVFKIHADGNTEVAKITKGAATTWDAGPVIKVDGTLVFKDQPVAKVNPDGSFVNLRTGDKLPITVTADNVLADKGGKQVGLSIAEDGKISLVGEGMPKSNMHAEGATTPGQRKAVMALMAALMH